MFSAYLQWWDRHVWLALLIVAFSLGGIFISRRSG